MKNGSVYECRARGLVKVRVRFGRKSGEPALEVQRPSTIMARTCMPSGLPRAARSSWLGEVRDSASRTKLSSASPRSTKDACFCRCSERGCRCRRLDLEPLAMLRAQPIFAFVTFAALVVGCTVSGGTTGPTTPTLVAVSPLDFAGDIPCADAPGAMRSYVVTLFDLGTAEEPQDAFALPSSVVRQSDGGFAPARCESATAFSFVIPGHRYDAEVEVYDRDDLRSLGAGSRQLVDGSGKLRRAAVDHHLRAQAERLGRRGAGDGSLVPDALRAGLRAPRDRAARHRHRDPRGPRRRAGLAVLRRRARSDLGLHRQAGRLRRSKPRRGLRRGSGLRGSRSRAPATRSQSRPSKPERRLRVGARPVTERRSRAPCSAQRATSWSSYESRRGRSDARPAATRPRALGRHPHTLRGLARLRGRAQLGRGG